MENEGQLIEEAAEAARHYLDKILLEPLSEVGLLLRDKVSFWRFKNQVRMIQNARTFLESEGISPALLTRTVFPDQIIPILESGGGRDEPKIAEMFARLLASAIDPRTTSTVHPSFAKILAELSAVDALLLGAVYRFEKAKVGFDPFTNTEEERYGISAKWLNVVPHLSLYLACEQIGRDKEETLFGYHNLQRSGLCRIADHWIDGHNERYLVPTPFGKGFIDSCFETI